MVDDLSTTRRNALRTSVAAASAIGLAGCQGLLGGGGDESFEEEVTRENPREVHVGQTVHGTLQEGDGRDPRYDDVAEPLEFELDEERRLAVSMTSGDFDTYLLVSRNGDTVAENDDGGARFNSEMVETFDSGTYTIWAGSFSGTGTGEYTLELSSAEADGGDGSTDEPQSIDLGSTVQGELRTSSPRDPVYDDLAVPYTVSLDEETRVRIRMQSETVDSYLLVTQNGTGVAENDDGGSGLNSDLITRLGAGEYTIWAGSFSGDDTGSFQLSLEALEERDVSPTAIELGDTVQGTLSADAPLDPVSHDLADPYRFTLDSETRIRITMDSGPIDPLVLVTRDGSAVAEDDDGGEGLNSDLITTLDAGTHTIWAGSFSGQDTGDYTLELTEEEPRDVSPESIDLGQTVQETLSASAPRDPIYDDLAAPWSFTLDEQTTVRISMSSEDFDTYLLVTQDGSTVVEDDDGGEEFNSALEATLDAGSYVIWAGSYSGSGTGQYTLELERV